MGPVTLKLFDSLAVFARKFVMSVFPDIATGHGYICRMMNSRELLTDDQCRVYYNKKISFSFDYSKFLRFIQRIISRI